MRRVGWRLRQEPACGGDWGWWPGASGSGGLQQGERALHPDLEALSWSWGCRGALVVGPAGLVQGPWQTLAHCAPRCRSPGCPSRPPECTTWDVAHPPDQNLVPGRRPSSLEARPAPSGISCPPPHSQPGPLRRTGGGPCTPTAPALGTLPAPSRPQSRSAPQPRPRHRLGWPLPPFIRASVPSPWDSVGALSSRR